MILDVILDVMFWLAVAFLIFVSGYLGVYLLFSGTDKLVVRWQNIRIRYSTRVLKDEHFGNVNVVITGFRCLGILLLTVCASISYFAMPQ